MYLRNAAALWEAKRHSQAIPLLVRAANAAKSRSGAPASDARVVELALAATELAEFVNRGEDPQSIPISIDFNTQSVDINSIDLQSIASSVLDITVEPPRRASHVNTLREEERPTPPPAPAPPTPPKPPSKVDLTQTLPQGARSPQPPAAPLNIRVVKPAQTPSTNSLREAPFTEPNDRASATPTKRMEDIPTKRAPDIEDPEKK
jgi:hypothetical protein